MSRRNNSYVKGGTDMADQKLIDEVGKYIHWVICSCGRKRVLSVMQGVPKMMVVSLKEY